jgi:hypothetical protein
VPGCGLRVELLAAVPEGAREAEPTDSVLLKAGVVWRRVPHGKGYAVRLAAARRGIRTAQPTHGSCEQAVEAREACRVRDVAASLLDGACQRGNEVVRSATLAVVQNVSLHRIATGSSATLAVVQNVSLHRIATGSSASLAVVQNVSLHRIATDSFTTLAVVQNVSLHRIATGSGCCCWAAVLQEVRVVRGQGATEKRVCVAWV